MVLNAVVHQTIHGCLCAILTPMSRFFPNAVCSFTSFFGFAFDLVVDGLRFLRLTVRSHSALGGEILFLRKQLAFYAIRFISTTGWSPTITAGFCQTASEQAV